MRLDSSRPAAVALGRDSADFSASMEAVGFRLRYPCAL